MAYVMTEDSLRGPEGDHAWHQMNSFSNPVMDYYVEDDMLPYVNAEGTMLTDVTYNDVVTAMSDVRGISGSLEGPQRAGQPVSHTFQLPLPAISQHRDNIHVVALLIDTTTGRIANAALCTPSAEASAVRSIALPTQQPRRYDLQGRRAVATPMGLTIEQRPDGTFRKIIR